MAFNAYNLSETPIVDQLGIQMKPLEGLEGIGALGELPKQEIEQMPMYEPIPNQNIIPIFQTEAQTPDPYINLQETYGTSYFPMFEWVKKVQVGEKIYEPSSPEDSQMLEEYKKFVAENGVPAGLPDPYDWKAVGKQVGMATLAASAPSIASNILGAATDPYITGGVGERVMAGAKQFLPFTDPLPSEIVGLEAAKGMDLVGKLGPNEVFIPELASKAAAEVSANPNIYNALNAGDTSSYVFQPGGMQFQSGVRTVNGQQVYNRALLEQNGIFANPDGSVTLAKGSGANISNMSKAITANTQPVGYLAGVKDKLVGSQAGQTWGQAGTMALVSFGINVASGMKPVEAAKSAGSSAVAYAIGASLFGPVGGWIASTVLAKPIQKAGSKIVEEAKGALDSVGDVLGDIGGGITSGLEKAGSAVSSGVSKVADTVSSVAKKVTGRVICNELRRQGLLETKHVLLDYKFTKEHLTPQHVAGYHFWAVNVVKRLRKGKGVKFWKHIAGHRANEIAYIYGERDKPDYLGKLYRKIFEPVCWGIGLFCKETDWSVLYEDKEIC